MAFLPSALSLFFPLTKKLEGYVPWMYPDIKGLVTTGMGNLIDSVGAAQALPWRHGTDGPLATQAEIAAAWHAVKNSDPEKWKLGGGNVYWQNLTDLRLDDDGIQQLVQSKVDSMIATTEQRYPMSPSWPAPAQLAVLLMDWAMGENFHYPKFQELMNAIVPDFKGASEEAYIPDNPQKSMNYPPTSNPGLRPRNVAIKLLLEMADRMQTNGDDYDDIDVTMLGDLSDAALSLAASVNRAAMDAVDHHFGRAGIIVGFLSGALGVAGGAYAIYKWVTESQQQ